MYSFVASGSSHTRHAPSAVCPWSVQFTGHCCAAERGPEREAARESVRESERGLRAWSPRERGAIGRKEPQPPRSTRALAALMRGRNGGVGGRRAGRRSSPDVPQRSQALAAVPRRSSSAHTRHRSTTVLVGTDDRVVAGGVGEAAGAAALPGASACGSPPTY